MKRALILCGGWPGHDPEAVAARFDSALREAGCETEIIRSTEPFADREWLMHFDLLVPVWSYTGENVLPDAWAVNIADAVANGMGVAGCHGGMCDAFRENVLWQFMTGSQWVAHPSLPFIHCTPAVPSREEDFFRDYRVRIADKSFEITRELSDFDIRSELYYLHLDPAVHVLAETVIERQGESFAPHLEDGPVTMPIAYTRHWGKGRIFYCALGHSDAEFDRFPEAWMLMRRGLLWALGSTGRQKTIGQSGGIDDVRSQFKTL